MKSLWSSSAAVTPPTSASMPESPKVCGHEVLAQPVDEVLDGGVLRGALGDHGQQRGVALLVHAHGRDEGDLGLLLELRRELFDLRLAGRVREVGGDDERAVAARPEALGVEVVGLAGHGARRVVAGVGEAEAHVERGDRQREQHKGRRDRGGPGPALDGVAPAPGERPLAARLLVQAAAEERQPQAVDPRPEVGEERGQQRDGGEHHDEHRERGGDGDAVHVGQAGEGEAEHGDHDDRAGEDHAAAGGGDGLEHRVVDGLPVGEGGAEAGQDEQGVVDADADPDQAGDRGRPVGDVDHVGEQHDQAAGGDAEAEEGDQERQAGRDDRAEGDQQHDRGAEEAEALGAGRLLRGVDRIAAELDLEAVAAVLLSGGDQLLAALLGDVPARDRQRQRRRADLAVLRDPDVGRGGDVLDLLGLGEEGVDALLRGGALSAGRVLPDDVDLLPGVAAEAVLGQHARSLRLRPRRVVVGVVLAGQRGADADDHDERGDPGQHHAAAAAIGDVCETGEMTSHQGGAPFLALAELEVCGIVHRPAPLLKGACRSIAVRVAVPRSVARERPLEGGQQSRAGRAASTASRASRGRSRPRCGGCRASSAAGGTARCSRTDTARARTRRTQGTCRGDRAGRARPLPVRTSTSANERSRAAL